MRPYGPSTNADWPSNKPEGWQGLQTNQQGQRAAKQTSKVEGRLRSCSYKCEIRGASRGHFLKCRYSSSHQVSLTVMFAPLPPHVRGARSAKGARGKQAHAHTQDPGPSSKASGPSNKPVRSARPAGPSINPARPAGPTHMTIGNGDCCGVILSVFHSSWGEGQWAIYRAYYV